jgi:ArsR family transcriptional regulator, arsenate/arsenite/antimonite-responsive transcriptional repressor
MTQMNEDPRSVNPGCCPDLGAVLDPSFFRALCHPRRVAILVRLAQFGRPATVGEIAACCPNDLSVVSRHLALLREAGVLSAEKRGREVHYALLVPTLCDTLRGMADAVEACCPEPEPLPGDDSDEQEAR